MAKQKRKKTKDSSFEHGVELYGLFLILCSILGIGKYGPVGRMIASFGLFLVLNPEILQKFYYHY